MGGTEATPGDALADGEARLKRIAEASLGPADISSLLEAFAERNGLSELAFDEAGLITFELGDALQISLTPAAGFPGLLAMTPLPEALFGHALAMRQLLASNLSWEATLGGTFARLPESDVIAYCRLMSLAEQDVELFERELLAFAEAAQSLIDDVELSVELEDDAMDDDDDEAPAADPPASFTKV